MWNDSRLEGEGGGNLDFWPSRNWGDSLTILFWDRWISHIFCSSMDSPILTLLGLWQVLFLKSSFSCCWNFRRKLPLAACCGLGLLQGWWSPCFHPSLPEGSPGEFKCHIPNLPRDEIPPGKLLLGTKSFWKIANVPCHQRALPSCQAAEPREGEGLEMEMEISIWVHFPWRMFSLGSSSGSC